MFNDGSNKVSWDVGTNINMANSNAMSSFTDLASNGSMSIADTMGRYNLIGINAHAIDDMRFAIRIYVENIEAHLNSVVKEAEDTGAFRGQYASSIVEYVQAVCDVCRSLTSQLLAFSDKLVEVKRAFEERDINLAQNINSASSNMQTGVNRYEEHE